MNGDADITRDWSEIWSKFQIEGHFLKRGNPKAVPPIPDVPFPFKGEGWYVGDDRTILIAHTTHKKTTFLGEAELYRVLVWERGDAVDVLTTALGLPSFAI